MTDFEAYQEYIQRKHNAFCKAVIRYAARDKILQLRRKWERQISLDYLMDEKFVQFAGPEPDEEYPLPSAARPPFCIMRSLPPPLHSCRSRHRKKFSATISYASRSA